MANKFGLEMEFVGDQARLVLELERRDIPVRHRGGWSETECVVKHDGSVYNGGEIALPPLDFDSKKRWNVNDVVAAMADADCRPSETCGIHVHVDATDLSWGQVYQVLLGSIRFEDFLARQGASGWERLRDGARDYAYPFGRTLKRTILQTEYRDDESVRALISSSVNRYNFVNFGNYFEYQNYGEGKPTLEFRVFNSSRNPDRIQAHIAVAVGMVKAAKYDKFLTPKLTPKLMFPLGGMYLGVRDENKCFNSMMRALSHNNRVLTPADRRNIETYWKTSRPQPHSMFSSGAVVQEWLRGEPALPPVARPTYNILSDDASISVADEEPYDEEPERYCGEHDAYYYGDCGLCAEENDIY